MIKFDLEFIKKKKRGITWLKIKVYLEKNFFVNLLDYLNVFVIFLIKNLK